MIVLNIGNNSSLAKYQLSKLQNNNNLEQVKEKKNNSEISNDDARLKEVVNDFTAILLNKMFDSMRETLPENKFLDAGFAEDVFSDMLYRKISKQGAGQEQFTSLNETLYQQLKQNG